MASVFALVSAGGSPGVTTAALALALGWPGPVIVAECDPSGGTVLAGALGGHVPGGFALMEHAIQAGRDVRAAAAGLASRLVPLDEGGTRLVLPGLTDPRQAAGLAGAWAAVAATLSAQEWDVIADCGRLDTTEIQPQAVIRVAAVVALVLRPTLRHVWAARARIVMLAELLGGTDRLALLVTGPGTHPAQEVSDVLGVPVAAALPADARSAAVLSDGAPRRRAFGSDPLMAAGRAAAVALRSQAESERAASDRRLGFASQAPALGPRS